MLLYARTSSVFRRCILTSRKGCIPFRKGDNMNTINATRTSATKFNTKYMVELALMVAVILVMSLRLHPYPWTFYHPFNCSCSCRCYHLRTCRRFNLWSDIRTYKLLSVLRWRRNGNCSSRN